MQKVAIIVSHGQPSDPEPAEAELAELAAGVAGLLPGWQLRSATLAAPGALAKAVKGAPGLCYPMFMAGGWFTGVHLPRRLTEAGGAGWRILPPFGLDQAVQDLAVRMVAEAGGGAVLVAAHGSFRSAAPAAVARALALRLLAAGATRCEAYFIDQTPQIATALGFGAGALCLPFFAARGGHVVDDLPKALAEAGFGGRVLTPLGCEARVPGLIAAAVLAAQALIAS